MLSGVQTADSKDSGPRRESWRTFEGFVQTIVTNQSQLGEKWQLGYQLDPGDTWNRRRRLDAKCEGIKVGLVQAVADRA